MAVVSYDKHIDWSLGDMLTRPREEERRCVRVKEARLAVPSARRRNGRRGGRGLGCGGRLGARKKSAWCNSGVGIRIGRDSGHVRGANHAGEGPEGHQAWDHQLSQTLQGCVTLAAGSAKAAKAIGWQSRTFDGQSSTGTQNTQIANAISWGAKVIELIAIDPSTVQTGLKVAKKAGALIVSADNSGSLPNPVIKAPAGDVWPKVDVSANYGALAEAEAHWMIANSKGKGNVLVYGDKEYPAIDAGVAGLLKVLKTCKGCTVSPFSTSPRRRSRPALVPMS